MADQRVKTCSDCGLSPIPALDVVYESAKIMCRACSFQAPKRITMWRFAPGQVWWNSASGGEPVEYIRADLVEGVKVAAKTKGGRSR